MRPCRYPDSMEFSTPRAAGRQHLQMLSTAKTLHTSSCCQAVAHTLHTHTCLFQVLNLKFRIFKVCHVVHIRSILSVIRTLLLIRHFHPLAGYSYWNPRKSVQFLEVQKAPAKKADARSKKGIGQAPKPQTHRLITGNTKTPTPSHKCFIWDSFPMSIYNCLSPLNSLLCLHPFLCQGTSVKVFILAFEVGISYPAEF